MQRHLRRVATLAAVCALLTSCATVQPWQRGNFAKPQMAFDQNPADSALRAHAYSSREAAASGIIGAGGGCGCY